MSMIWFKVDKIVNHWQGVREIVNDKQNFVEMNRQ